MIWEDDLQKKDWHSKAQILSDTFTFLKESEDLVQSHTTAVEPNEQMHINLPADLQKSLIHEHKKRIHFTRETWTLREGYQSTLEKPKLLTWHYWEMAYVWKRCRSFID